MRDITALHPDLQEKVYQFKALCEKNGLKAGIGECLRTVAEQDALYAIGRTKPGTRVTNARGSTYSSQHQWGIAFDFYRNDGTGAFNTAGGFFDQAGALAKSIGLGWGGDWKSPVDKPHLYLPWWGNTPLRLKSEYGTPERFRATWQKKPVFEINKIYAAKAGFYLWKRPGAEKVRYEVLSDKMKKKCSKKKKHALLKKGAKFRLMETKRAGTDVWGKIKAGYWIRIARNGKSRIHMIP